jgi:predicted amidohydrolase
MNVRIGIVQLECRIGAYESNIDRAGALLRECVQGGCSLVCLPEAFATTLDFGGVDAVSETIPGKTSTWLCDAAVRYRIWLCAGILERRYPRAYSSTVLISPSGEIAVTYRRAHVFSLEGRFLARGDGSFPVVETNIGRIGLMAGYDINFPEASRILFLRRAEIILCPVQIPRLYAAATVCLARARAQECSACFVLASSVGENSAAGFEYMGSSCIVQSCVGVDPYSTDYVAQRAMLSSVGDSGGEGCLCADVDVELLRRLQEQNPHYADRCPALYGELLSTAGHDAPVDGSLWGSAVYRIAGRRS